MSCSCLWKGLVLAGIVSAPLLVNGLAHAAPREITDYEARKLTFSALTATPVVRHRSHKVKKSYALASRRKGKATVRTVSYHGRVVTHHKRNRHQRRG